VATTAAPHIADTLAPDPKAIARERLS
jgi:hypothetical protein